MKGHKALSKVKASRDSKGNRDREKDRGDHSQFPLCRRSIWATWEE